jgi:hypothetical protein
MFPVINFGNLKADRTYQKNYEFDHPVKEINFSCGCMSVPEIKDNHVRFNIKTGKVKLHQIKEKKVSAFVEFENHISAVYTVVFKVYSENVFRALNYNDDQD